MFEAVRLSVSVFAIPFFMVFASSVLADPPTGPRQIDCPDNLQEEIDESETNDVLEVTGDCIGSIVVSIDGLTLRALAGATLTGDGVTPAISITGNRVTIEGWSLIDGITADGIVVGASGSAQVRNITLIKGNDGIVVTDAASVEIDNVSDIDATDDGIFAVFNGVALITNTNSSDNGDDGVVVGAGGVIALNGGNTINNNSRYGIFASGGQVRIGGANTIQGNSNYDVRCTGFTRILVTQTLSSSSSQELVEPGLCFVTGPASLF